MLIEFIDDLRFKFLSRHCPFLHKPNAAFVKRDFERNIGAFRVRKSAVKPMKKV